VRRADGKHSFPSTLTRGTAAAPQPSLSCCAGCRIQASPHNGHCAFQHSRKKANQKKSPRSSDQDISCSFRGGGKAVGPPPKAQPSQQGCHHLRYGAPEHQPRSLAKPWGQRGLLHGQHPCCCWCHRPAGDQGPGQTLPSSLGSAGFQSKPKTELSS